jgi:hypothetical protein
MPSVAFDAAVTSVDCLTIAVRLAAVMGEGAGPPFVANLSTVEVLNGDTTEPVDGSRSEDVRAWPRAEAM